MHGAKPSAVLELNCAPSAIIYLTCRTVVCSVNLMAVGIIFAAYT